MRKISAWTLLFFAFPTVAVAEVVVGFVTDGPAQRYIFEPEVLEREIRSLVGREFEVTFPDEKRIDGGWTLEGVRGALRKLLADPEVDVVITLGVVASNEVARIPELSKPVITPVVVDGALQGFPLEGAVSGKRNFVYLTNFFSLGDEFRSLKTVSRFTHLAVLADPMVSQSVPELPARARQLATDLGAQITLVPVTGSVEEALAAIPAGADAVYLAPLLRLNLGDIGRLAEGLVARKLPSMSLMGHEEVERGILLTNQPPEDQTRIARRVALNLQRILLGEPASGIEVGIPRRQRLTINMRTARAIRFSPRFAILADAEKLFEDEVEAGRELTLLGAIEESLRVNLALQSAQVNVDIAGDDVASARAALLPQLDVQAIATQIDSDRAIAPIQAERSRDAQVNLSQIIYSDRVRSGLQVAELLKGAEDQDYAAEALDTVQRTATAYLNVLRAKALEAVRLSNVEVTRTNLDLARVREAIGISGRSDVLRWESQLAADRQAVLAAEADRRQAETEVNRILHRPQSEGFSTVESGLEKPMSVIADPRFERFIDNPIAWETFQEFSIGFAVEHSPELNSLDAIIAAQERLVTTAKRAYYLPDVLIAGNAGTNLSRSGAGSDLSALDVDDESWNVSLQATLPIYAGGARRAELSRTSNALRQLRIQRNALYDSVAARVLAAMQQAGGSYPAIELSRAAANAAASNLELVIDQYSKGVVSVTDLIDAQDAALSAELAAAEAVYQFLIDYVEVLRASGDFALLLDPASSGAWLDQVEAYFREKGVSP